MGGNFTSIGGAASGLLARLNNNQPVFRSLTITGTSEIARIRDGGLPEIERVTFESWSGSSWVARGAGTRIAGGWSLSSPGLGTTSWIRARGYAIGGRCNGSSGIIEQIAAYGTRSFPDIEVKNPAGDIMVSASSFVDFGSKNWLASPATKIFAVTHTDNGILSGLSYAFSGIHPEDFTGSSLGTTSLAPGATLTFTINFSPNGGGGRYAVLSINSNDADETPFLVTLQGTNLNPEATVNPDGNETVNALALQADGKVLTGGEFTSVGGLVRNRLCRLLANLNLACGARFRCRYIS